MKDMSWMHPNSSQVASIVPPKTTEINILEPIERSRVIRLILDWAIAAALSSSEITTLKNGICLITKSVLNLFPSASTKINLLLKVILMDSRD